MSFTKTKKSSKKRSIIIIQLHVYLRKQQKYLQKHKNLTMIKKLRKRKFQIQLRVKMLKQLRQLNINNSHSIDLIFTDSNALIMQLQIVCEYKTNYYVQLFYYTTIVYQCAIVIFIIYNYIESS